MKVLMKEIKKGDGNLHYVCEKCGFAYREKEWAERCEAWCSKHRGCNLDITQHAVKSG
jgi:rubrerythrin